MKLFVERRSVISAKMPKMLISALLAGSLAAGGWYVDSRRELQRSSLSGFFENQPVQLASRIGGRVVKILVKEGDSVQPGAQVVLLEAQSSQDQSAYKQALAEQSKAQLAEIKNGSRPEEILKQEAASEEMRAGLQRLRSGPLPEEIAAARAKLNAASAQLQKTRHGPRKEEIEQAQASERMAYAHLEQLMRGLTPEERAQFKARLDAAQTAEDLNNAELQRSGQLYRQGAISRELFDRAAADRNTAAARKREMSEAYRRAAEGNPAEEIEQARESYLQVKATLDLIKAGSRKEDIQAAASEEYAAYQNLKLLLRGSRQEDIQAAESRLAQAEYAFKLLRKGSRIEDIRKAEAAYRASAADAASQKNNSKENTIRCIQGGIVERVLVAVGDLIAPNAPVVRMADPTDIWIRVYIQESQLSKVHVGSPAVLRVDGITASVDGEVESIAVQGEFTPANLQTPEERGKQVFAVRLRIKPFDSRVKAGMSATVKSMGEWR